MNFISKEKELVWAQILYLFIIPTLLLYFDVIPGDFRLVLLFGVAFIMLGIVSHNNWTFKDLGIFKNFKKDTSPYLIFTISGIIFLLLLSQIVSHSPFLNWWKNISFLLLFIPISVIQEVIFRGVLMKFLLDAFKNPIFIIGLNASLFALIHVIYMNTTFVLSLTFVAGIGFAWMYYKYPNLILISISHTILNFIGMILGFFVIR